MALRSQRKPTATGGRERTGGRLIPVGVQDAQAIWYCFTLFHLSLLLELQFVFGTGALRPAQLRQRMGKLASEKTQKLLIGVNRQTETFGEKSSSRHDAAKYFKYVCIQLGRYATHTHSTIETIFSFKFHNFGINKNAYLMNKNNTIKFCGKFSS